MWIIFFKYLFFKVCWVDDNANGFIKYCNKLITVCYKCGATVMFSGDVWVLITVIESYLVIRTKSIITVILFVAITIYVILYYIMFIVVVLK